LLGSIARGGVMIMLIILLQGIWLPLHHYSYTVTPFSAGIYMSPMLAGFIIMGPISGWLSDRYGARGLSTGGMAIVATTFLLLYTLPYDFNYLVFAPMIFAQGIGMGMFASPNTASIMNSVPPMHRGAASGMRATMQNAGQTASIALFFVIIIEALHSSLPSALNSHLLSAGVPASLSSSISKIPPTGALFAAFLGENPMATLLSSYPHITSLIGASVYSTITGSLWFPRVIAPPFMSSLQLAFLISAVIAAVASVSSLLRGRIYIYDLEEGTDVSKQGAPAKKQAAEDRTRAAGEEKYLR
ncbi:MAG: MFS transporter, partial [Methanomassiliicoccales archaeon]